MGKTIEQKSKREERGYEDRQGRPDKENKFDRMMRRSQVQTSSARDWDWRDEIERIEEEDEALSVMDEFYDSDSGDEDYRNSKYFASEQ